MRSAAWSPPGATNTWLKNYIFPGGYTPALSEVMTAIEKVGLWVTDIEILRLHYAETLRHWRQRFLDNRERIMQLAGLRMTVSAACGSSISPAARSRSGT
jgi:cyclopropane fatty-acyl-phospholipid synthase-like methyltransferase